MVASPRAVAEPLSVALTLPIAVALTEVTSNDDARADRSSRVTLTAIAGTTYRVAVDGFGDASGSIALSLTLQPGAQLNIGNVTDFAFDESGRWLAITIDAQDGTGKITVDFSTLVASWPLANGDYVLQLTATNGMVLLALL